MQGSASFSFDLETLKRKPLLIVPAALLLVVAAGLAYRFQGDQELPVEAYEPVVLFLQTEYGRERLREMEAMREQGQLPDEAWVRDYQDAQRIEIQRITRRGYGNEEFLARVEFTVKGSPPPDGESPRFVYMRRNLGGGYSFVRESYSTPWYWRD